MNLMTRRALSVRPETAATQTSPRRSSSRQGLPLVHFSAFEPSILELIKRHPPH
jgi:hypothetical protein